MKTQRSQDGWLPILTARTTAKSPSEASVKQEGIEMSGFSTQQEILQATERQILKLQQTRGHELLDSEFKLTLSSIKKKSEKNIIGARDFRVKKAEDEPSYKTIEANMLSHMMLKVRKKSTPVIIQTKMEGSEPQPIERKVISFFNSVRDPNIIKAADGTLESNVRAALDRKDLMVFQSTIADVVNAVHKVLDSIENSYSQLQGEHLEIMVDICRKKLDFIDKSFGKALSFASNSFIPYTARPTETQGSLENTGFGSSLTFDVKYLMATLQSQAAYYQSKMAVFQSGDQKAAEETSALFGKYMDNKTLLQVKSQKLDFLQFVDDHQSLLEDWVSRTTTLKLQCKKREFEIEGLKGQIEELKTTIDKERTNFREIQTQMKAQMGPDMVAIKKKFEENFAMVMNNLKEEVQKAQEDKSATLKENDELRKIVHVFEMDKLRRESKNQSKGTQSVFQIGASKEIKQLFTDVINSPEKTAISKGDSSSKFWLCSVINHLIVARLNYEAQKDNQNNAPKSMKDFIIESLLVKFGSAQATEHILRDIIASIKKYSSEGERFKLFAKFLGIEDILTNDFQKKRKPNKYEDFLTNYYYTSHLAIRDYLEFVLLAKGFEYHEDSSLKPLLGFCTSKRTQQLMIQIDVAKKIFVLYIMNREPKQFLQPERLQEEFDNILKEDLYDRLHEKGKEIKIKNFKSVEYLISYDYLAKVLLERRLSYFMDDVQKFVSALTVSSASRGEKNIFYDDLNFSCRTISPSVTEDQIGQIFREIADSPQLQSYSIEKMIQSAVHTITLISKSQKSLDLNLLAVTKESYDERAQMIIAAEYAINTKLRANTIKKEGSKFQALIDGLASWREKYMVGSTSAFLDGADSNKLLEKWRVDNISGLVFLQESYEKTKDRIILAEKYSEQIGPSHAQLRDFLSNVPEKLVFRYHYEELKEHDQVSLSEQIDSMWKQLRRIISLTFFHNQTD